MNNQTPADAISPDGVEWRQLIPKEDTWQAGDQIIEWETVHPGCLLIGVRVDSSLQGRRPTPALPVSTAIGAGETNLKGGDEKCPEKSIGSHPKDLGCDAASLSDPTRAAEPDFIIFARLLAKELDTVHHMPITRHGLASAITRAIQQFKTNGQR